MTVWVVYSQFPDDPSLVYGIFLTEEEAIKCKESISQFDSMGMVVDIYEIQVGVYFPKGISLQ